MKLSHFWSRALKWLDTIIMTPSCLLCYRTVPPRTGLCETCLAGLPWQEETCRRCGGPLRGAEVVCGYCLLSAPSFHKVVTAFHYQPPIDRWIIGLKFQAKLHHVRLLSTALTTQLQRFYEEDVWPEAIIPVPLHRWRLFKRGFNQALEIAKPISKTLKIPLITNGVARHRQTQAQSKLPGDERHKNVKKAFRVLTALPTHVAIVDDILTTGYTVNELTECLLKSGVQRVDVWCCARTDSSHLLP